MSAMQRTKGAVGEREWAAVCREHGYEGAARGRQYRGGSDSPDTVGVPGVHFEVKRTERLQLYAAVDQSRRDAASGAVPVVAHRCNDDRRANSCRGDWLVVFSAADFFVLLNRAGMGPATEEQF